MYFVFIFLGIILNTSMRFQNMDSNHLLTDFLDSYFNDPLSDDNNLKPRCTEFSSGLPRPKFQEDGPTLNPDTSMSTPNHVTSEKVSPCFELNYGPMMSHADAFSSSTRTSNPLYLDRSDPATELDDIFKSPTSPSSSTISIRSPIPPPTPSPEHLQCLPDIDINNNSNETISADEDDTDADTPELIIEESRQSQPSPLVVSASPLVTFTIPDNVMIRSEDVLDHHFDVQLSPAMAAQCTDTSTQHVLSSEEVSVASHQEPVEIYTIQGTTILRSTESVNLLKPQIYTSDEQSLVTSQEKPVEIDLESIPEGSLPLSPEAIKSPRVVTSPYAVEVKGIDVEIEDKSPEVPIPVFKTDLTKFASRSRLPNQVSVIVTAKQSGQNIIPLVKHPNQRERLWHVDQDDSFNDVPVVKASPEPRKRRGRPRGSKNKRFAGDLDLALTPRNSVCARCVELSQQIR